jgi:signal transduction histidine kinase
MKPNQDAKQRITQLEQEVTNLTRLIEVTSVMNSVLLRTDVSRKTLLSYLMDAAADITDSESAAVLLWRTDKQALVFAATTSNDSNALALIGKPTPIDSIAGTVYQEKRVVTVNDASADSRHYSRFDKDNEFVTRSLLGIPMISNKRVIGVLEVVNKRTLPWTPSDRTNLSLLASEAAVAIEVAQLLAELQEANEELSELDSLKSSFIAIASHELRTPLGIIMGYVSFLQEAEDEEVSGNAAKVMFGAMQLRAIIDNMVSLRYLKQKKSELRRQVISLDTMTDDLKKDITTLADINDRKLIIECKDGDSQVLVDRGRLSMAFINIIKNAVAFTQPGGSINVEISIGNEREVYICVGDDGIGLELNQLSRIFEEFYQVEDHMIRKHGGLGIGLSISRALVHAHGGRLWAFSEGLNQGATFTIALPLARYAEI